MLNYNIFYTDDDKDDQDIFRDAVSEVDARVQLLTQDDGEELISLLNNPPPSPSLIFLDLNMPVKNGFDVLKEIRETEHMKTLPVIIFSTSDDPDAIAATKSLGANLYIPKPKTYSSLKKALSYALSIDWLVFTPNKGDFVYRTN